MVTSVWRVAHGYPLYTKPTLDFVPYLYAPLYFYLAAALTKVVGAGYASLRLVSILGTLGTFGVIYALIHGETRSRLAGLAGAGLYAACYYPLQGWFDIGRVDALFMFLFLLAIYCTRRAPILLAVLLRMLRRRDVAEDVLQDVFVKVWQQASQYDQGRGRPLAWLVSIARYRAIDLQRAHRPTVVIDEEQAMHEPQFQVAGPAEGAEALAAGSALMRCLELIAAPQRRCIVLAYADGLTHDQIARSVGEPLGTVKSWVRRSLLSLRRCLDS